MSNLSAREQEVAALLLEGRSNKQIAAALGISERTVEFHLNNIYGKYGVASRVELILKLGESTVARGAQTGDDPNRRNPRNWANIIQSTAAKIGQEFSMTEVENARAAGTQLTFFEALRACFVQYAQFQGRATRAEFWWFFLFVVLVSSALQLLHETAAAIFLIAVLLPLLAAGARRLRDAGKNPWLLLYLLVPVGGLLILAWYWSQPPASELEQQF